MSNSSKLRTAAPASKREENVIDKSLHDFVSLFEAVPYGFVLIDEKGDVAACNSVGRSMFQYRNVDIVGFDSKDLVCRPDRNMFVDCLHRCTQMIAIPAKYTSLQIEGLRKDGSNFPVEIHMKTCLLSGRELIACTLRDITRRRQNEISIRTKEEKLQLALQGAELWLWEYDCLTKSLTYEIQNSAISNLANKEIQMEFDSWVDLIHMEDRESVLTGWSKLLEDEINEFEFEYRVKRKNGNWDWIYS